MDDPYKAQRCRHCTWLVRGDANWCSEREVTLKDSYIRNANRCRYYEYNPIDAITLVDKEGERRAAVLREKKLYEKRMRGDWS